MAITKSITKKTINKEITKKIEIKKIETKKVETKKVEKNCLICKKLCNNTLCLRCSNKCRNIKNKIDDYDIVKVKKTKDRPCDGCGNEDDCCCEYCNNCCLVITKLYDGTLQKCIC